MLDLKSKRQNKAMNNNLKELFEKTKMDSANEIADQFTPGFFDDRMVSDVANIIGAHFEKFSKQIIDDCTSLISLSGTTHCFTDNGYGVGYIDGRNDAAYMIQSFYENDQNKS